MFTSFFAHQDTALSFVGEPMWLVREIDTNASFVCSIRGISTDILHPASHLVSTDSGLFTAEYL